MLRKILTLAAILVIFTSAEVSAGEVINYDAERVIKNVVRVTNSDNISIWGKEYYTYEGVRYCRFHWGNAKNNLILFRLNDNNHVKRAIVSAPSSIRDQCFSMAEVICSLAGLSTGEIDDLVTKINNDIMANPYVTSFKKIYPIFSTNRAIKKQKNIIQVMVEFKDNYDFYCIYED